MSESSLTLSLGGKKRTKSFVLFCGLNSLASFGAKVLIKQRTEAKKI